MSVRSCRVTIQDMDGVSHTVEVTAATLYEAVAQGLAAIRGNDWVAGIAQGLNAVRVAVAGVRVEREVSVRRNMDELRGPTRRVSRAQHKPEPRLRGATGDRDGNGGASSRRPGGG